MFFKENFKYLRKQKGLSQKEIAEKIGVQQGQVSKYEKGLSTPDFETLQTIVEVLGTSYDDLLTVDLTKVSVSKVEESVINYDTGLVGVIVRLEAELKSKEALLSTVDDPEVLKKLIELKEQLIKENPKRARELGLL